MEGWWNETDSCGKPGFVFNKKLKHLKLKLQEWNRDKLGRIDLKIKECHKILGELEQKEKQMDLSNQELVLKDETNKMLEQQLNKEETYWFSRAKTKWNKEGESLYKEECLDRPTLDGLELPWLNAISLPEPDETKEGHLVWTVDLRGEFTVRSAFEEIRVKRDKKSWHANIWNSHVPVKAAATAWKLLTNAAAVDDSI
ncbi:hypothetical protein IFM89_039769 [Coptis chinensis]|uniref:Reverse transcriptase zinc-binding domain-containing protein n=1 Tax=Coptis chinensis TaxID=261450 RepID=A0A835GSV2_9MAGN|nr:hypothetical protein IFM89_039769 [Coptis chinensis]